MSTGKIRNVFLSSGGHKYPRFLPLAMRYCRHAQSGCSCSGHQGESKNKSPLLDVPRPTGMPPSSTLSVPTL
jgi:hypothetical protein